MVFEQKAADRVIAKAKITEIPADEWNAILTDEKGDAGETTKKTSRKTTKKKTTSKKTGSK